MHADKTPTHSTPLHSTHSLTRLLILLCLQGTLAAWCKLYLFSQKQLMSGRWRLRLLQPPVDVKCFSTDTLVAPSFHGADLCVRLGAALTCTRTCTRTHQPRFSSIYFLTVLLPVCVACACCSLTLAHMYTHSYTHTHTHTHTYTHTHSLTHTRTQQWTAVQKRIMTQ